MDAGRGHRYRVFYSLASKVVWTLEAERYSRMRTKPVLTADEGRQIISAARAEAERNRWNVTIAVVDDGGMLVALERLDRAAPHTAKIATEKARSAAIMRLPTKTMEDLVKDRPALVTMPGVTRVQGGLPVFVGDECVGAVGVSGATSQQDEQVAAAGIAALGLIHG